jgi:DNA-binding NtrC family response regulator
MFVISAQALQNLSNFIQNKDFKRVSKTPSGVDTVFVLMIHCENFARKISSDIFRSKFFAWVTSEAGERNGDKMVLPRILIIDDEKNIRRTLGLVLSGEGYDTVELASAEEGLKFLETEGADLVILDIKLPGMSGIDMLNKVRGGNRDIKEIPIIMISGHASLSEAVNAVKLGATDFFEKPLDRDAILIRVHNCLKQVRLARRVDELQAQIADRSEIVGDSPAVLKLLDDIRKVAPTKSRVLITGESGTGKELIARAIHQQSLCSAGPFIKVNCAAIPQELIESELFGYEKGAFTGADKRKAGQFELADGGTLFLDEIGDMSLNAQVKVLRVLQFGELTRVGGQSTLNVDVRVLAATNRNLEEAVAKGYFREDLFFRLNVVPIKAAPLRDRLSDVPVLLKEFVRLFCKENGFREKAMDPAVIRAVSQYSWPGNVRELRNLAERLMIMSGDRITLDDVPEQILEQVRFTPTPTASAATPCPSSSQDRLPLREYREIVERQYIADTLQENDWNISRTAQILGIERTNLHKKLKVLGLSRGDEE